MSETEQQRDEGNEYVDSEDTGDQFSGIYGDWGRWQMLCFCLTGFAVSVCSCPTLIMTFMNAKIDFWCQRPENLRGLDIKDWRALSGGLDEKCQIFNLSYTEMTSIEAQRYICRIDQWDLTKCP